MTERQNEYFTDHLVRFPYYGPQGRAVTSNGMTIVIESHDPAPCVVCGGTVGTDPATSDLDICSGCGWRRMRPQAKQAAAVPDVREALAAYAHEAWAGWMRYLFSKCANTDNPAYPVSMPSWAVERWMRQMDTPYADLSEEEKASDRAEADKILVLLGEG